MKIPTIISQKFVYHQTYFKSYSAKNLIKQDEEKERIEISVKMIIDIFL